MNLGFDARMYGLEHAGIGRYVMNLLDRLVEQPDLDLTIFISPQHAAKFAEMLGEVVTDSTKKNLEMRVEAENGACAGKKALAKMAKDLNLDAIHDTVHEMAKDEARHGCAFEGLLKRYFG